MIFFLQKNKTEKHKIEYYKMNNPTKEDKLSSFADKQNFIAKNIYNSGETIELETTNLIDKTIHFVNESLDKN